MNIVMLVGVVHQAPRDFGSGPVKLKVKTEDSFMNSAGELKTYGGYHEVVCWRSKDYVLGLEVGEMVEVKGQLKNGKYEKDGATVYTYGVSADSVQRLVEKAGENPGGPSKGGFGDDDVPF